MCCFLEPKQQQQMGKMVQGNGGNLTPVKRNRISSLLFLFLPSVLVETGAYRSVVKLLAHLFQNTHPHKPQTDAGGISCTFYF
jgi:hypothetical protein